MENGTKGFGIWNKQPFSSEQKNLVELATKHDYYLQATSWNLSKKAWNKCEYGTNKMRVVRVVTMNIKLASSIQLSNFKMWHCYSWTCDKRCAAVSKPRSEPQWSLEQNFAYPANWKSISFGNVSPSIKNNCSPKFRNLSNITKETSLYSSAYIRKLWVRFLTVFFI